MEGYKRAALVALPVIAIGALIAILESSTAPPSVSHERRPIAAPGAPPLRAVPRPDLDFISDDMPANVTVTSGEGVTSPEMQRLAAAKLNQTIELYRTTMQYPLWSRPADDSTDHLTHWNHLISVGQPFAVDASQREVAANASIDRVFAAPGTAITLQVTGSHVDDGSPASLDQVRAQLQWRDRARDSWVTVQDVPLQFASGAWSGSITPSKIPALQKVSEARLVASAQVGTLSHDFALDFAYTIQPPVVVRSIAAERVKDGQLEVDLDVDVTSVGTVGLTATLFAPDGTTAIAVYSDRYFPTHAGSQVIPIRFFGKILHDRKIDGPYRIGAIHGYVYHWDVPDVLFDRPDAPALTTLAYSAMAFSATGYQDPSVDARIAQYQEIRDGLGTSQSPPSVPPAPSAP